MADERQSGESLGGSNFLDSIGEFSSESLDRESDESIIRTRKKGSMGLLRLMVIIICFALFSYSIYSLYEIYKSNITSDSLYGDIYNSFSDILLDSFGAAAGAKPSQSSGLSSSPFTPSKGGEFNTIIQAPTSLKFQQALSKLESLRSTNKDTAGYISVSGTGINYPIVQCEDNEYYLNHGFDDSTLKSGTIFYDYRCSPTPSSNTNLIIYGHNMQNGTMFQQLENYTENEELFKQGTITIYAFDAIYTYEIFSVYFTNAYSDYLDISFRSTAEYEMWLAERVEFSLFKKEVELNKDSKIVSLSTCINATSDGRIAVHGVLTNVER